MSFYVAFAASCGVHRGWFNVFSLPRTASLEFAAYAAFIAGRQAGCKMLGGDSPHSLLRAAFIAEAQISITRR